MKFQIHIFNFPHETFYDDDYGDGLKQISVEEVKENRSRIQIKRWSLEYIYIYKFLVRTYVLMTKESASWLCVLLLFEQTGGGVHSFHTFCPGREGLNGMDMGGGKQLSCRMVAQTQGQGFGGQQLRAQGTLEAGGGAFGAPVAALPAPQRPPLPPRASPGPAAAVPRSPAPGSARPCGS